MEEIIKSTLLPACYPQINYDEDQKEYSQQLSDFSSNSECKVVNCHIDIQDPQNSQRSIRIPLSFISGKDQHKIPSEQRKWTLLFSGNSSDPSEIAYHENLLFYETTRNTIIIGYPTFAKNDNQEIEYVMQNVHSLRHLLEIMTTATQQIMNVLNVQQCFVVGHSMGSIMALHVALHDERVIHVFLVAGIDKLHTIATHFAWCGIYYIYNFPRRMIQSFEWIIISFQNNWKKSANIANKIRIISILIGKFMLNIIKYSLLFIIISILFIIGVILSPFIILLKMLITPWVIKKILNSYQWEIENTADKLKKTKSAITIIDSKKDKIIPRNISLSKCYYQNRKDIEEFRATNKYEPIVVLDDCEGDHITVFVKCFYLLTQ